MTEIILAKKIKYSVDWEGFLDRHELGTFFWIWTMNANGQMTLTLV